MQPTYRRSCSAVLCVHCLLHWGNALRALSDTLLYLIKQDGYGIGEMSIIHRGRQCAYIDAYRKGQRWVVMADSRYEAACELMLQLGRDLMDG